MCEFSSSKCWFFISHPDADRCPPPSPLSLPACVYYINNATTALHQAPVILTIILNSSFFTGSCCTWICLKFYLWRFSNGCFGGIYRARRKEEDGGSPSLFLPGGTECVREREKTSSSSSSASPFLSPSVWGFKSGPWVSMSAHARNSQREKEREKTQELKMHFWVRRNSWRRSPLFKMSCVHFTMWKFALRLVKKNVS